MARLERGQFSSSSCPKGFEQRPRELFATAAGSRLEWLAQQEAEFGADLRVVRVLRSMSLTLLRLPLRTRGRRDAALRLLLRPVGSLSL